MAGLPGRVRALAESLGRVRRGQSRAWSFSFLDWAVASYGASAVLSALCSAYGSLAREGYDGLVKGAWSQVLFVGVYFFVSRQYDGAAWPLYLGEGAVALVTLLGLLHRLGVDPLGLHEGWNVADWEYGHMLSTLGTINWFCGFYSVALAFVAGHYLWEERKWLQPPLYGAAAGAFVLMGIQGSQGGLLILAVCMGMCLLAGYGKGVPAVYRLLSGHAPDGSSDEPPGGEGSRGAGRKYIRPHEMVSWDRRGGGLPSAFPGGEGKEGIRQGRAG